MAPQDFRPCESHTLCLLTHSHSSLWRSSIRLNALFQKGYTATMSATAASGAHFEIKLDGIARTHRDERDTAIEAARFLQQRNSSAKIVITDLRDGSVVSFDRSA